MSTNSATIAFRVKPEIKKQADRLFERLGMTTSTAMKILLMQTLLHNGFPAPFVVPEAQPPKSGKRNLVRDADNRTIS